MRTAEASPHIAQTAINPDTLGAAAVSSLEQIVDIELNGPDPDNQAWLHPASNVRYELRTIRRSLNDASVDQKDVVEAYCRTLAPQYLQGVKAKETEKAPRIWNQWLANEAADEQLLNFLQWHGSVMHELQTDAAFHERVEKQREEYKIDVATGIEEGWLHPTAAEAVQSVDEIDVYVGDIFSTSMKDIAGYHDRGSTHVVVAGGYGGDVDEWGILQQTPAIRILKHEFNHAVLGGFEERWLNEAVTEHIARVFEHGESELVDPAQRGNGMVYYEERRLLATLLNDGDKVIPAELATRAYSEKTPLGDERFNEERSEFFRAVEGAWVKRIPLPDNLATAQGLEGGFALGTINNRIQELERSYKMRGFSDMHAQTKALYNVRCMLLATGTPEAETALAISF